MQLRSPSSFNVRKPLYLWNLMIRNTTNEGLFTETLNIYSSMTQSGVRGNSHTIPLVIKACANLGSIRDGTKLHSHAIRDGFQADNFVQTALVGMYEKCFDIVASRKVFDEMTGRGVVSWNAMISSYCHGLLIDEALTLLKEMWVLGVEPSSATFISILSCCGMLVSFASFYIGLSIHCCLVKLGQVNSEVTLTNSLMSMYIQFGLVDVAHGIFNTMSEKSIISWTTIINGHVKLGNVAEAFDAFCQMRHSGDGTDSVVLISIISGCAELRSLLIASSVHCLVLKTGCGGKDPIENLLVSLYAKCGDIATARKIFDMVSAKCTFLWTSMIGGYAHQGHPAEALNLFKELLKTDTKPNEATMSVVLSACADIGSLSLGEEIKEYVRLNGLESDNRVQASLIYMFCKCGSINKARHVFDKVGDKDLAVWSAMINAYAVHGMGKEALNLFHMMESEHRLKPDAIVYTSILQACSHSGMEEDGLKYFQSMQKDYGIEPSLEHHICLVDLLSRVGKLDLAFKYIQEMPFQAQNQAWAPFLSACRTHQDTEMGEVATEKLMESMPQSSANYVLMSNLYASMGKLKKAHTIRKYIDDKGLVKERGWSQVEIDGTLHFFVSGDQSHWQSFDMYKKLEELNANLLEDGSMAERLISDTYL